MQGTGFEKYEVMRMSRTVTSVSGFQFVEARAFTAWRMQSPCDFSEVVWLCAAHPLSPQVCAGGHLPTTFCAMPPPRHPVRTLSVPRSRCTAPRAPRTARRQGARWPVSPRLERAANRANVRLF